MQLRFRAIDKRDGRAFEPDDLLCMGNTAPSWEKPCVSYGLEFDTDLEPEHCVLSQSTGLTDSRGREIFDGDVLLWNGVLWVAHYRDAGYFLHHFHLPKDRGHPLSPLHLKVANVIGNKYESPDILRARAESL